MPEEGLVNFEGGPGAPTSGRPQRRRGSEVRVAVGEQKVGESGNRARDAR